MEAGADGPLRDVQDLRDALDTAKGLRKTFYLRGDAKIDDAMLDARLRAAEALTRVLAGRTPLARWLERNLRD